MAKFYPPVTVRTDFDVPAKCMVCKKPQNREFTDNPLLVRTPTTGRE